VVTGNSADIFNLVVHYLNFTKQNLTFTDVVHLQCSLRQIGSSRQMIIRSCLSVNLSGKCVMWCEYWWYLCDMNICLYSLWMAGFEGLHETGWWGDLCRCTQGAQEWRVGNG